MSAGADEDRAGLGVLVRATRRTTSRVYGGPSRRPALPSTGALQPQVPTLGNGESSPTVAPSSPVLPAAKPRRRNSLRSCRGRAWGCSGVRDSPARAFLWENPSEKQLFPQNANGGLCLRHRPGTVRLRRGLGLPAAVRPRRAWGTTESPPGRGGDSTRLLSSETPPRCPHPTWPSHSEPLTPLSRKGFPSPPSCTQRKAA